MRKKHGFCAYKLNKIGCALCLTVILILQITGCNHSKNSSATITKQLSVTDQAYAFVNSRTLPENAATEYQYDTELKITDSKRIFYGAGTCSYLKEKRTVVLFFIDDDVSHWNKKDIQDFTENNALPALNFIEEEAERWGVDLSFEIWRFSSALSTGLELKYDGTVNPNLFNGGSTKDLFSQAAKAFGYSCDMAFRWALMEKSGGIEIIPVFLLNKGGISYARNNYIVGPVEAAEHAVVFADSQYGARDQSATFAHELLHLYGAEELYTPAQRDALSSDLYPYDIMFLETRNLNKLKIDGFTAYTLGWNKTMPSICNNREWYSDSYYQNYRDWFE